MKQSIYNSRKESVACNYGTRSDELAGRIAAGQAIGFKAYHLQSSANHSVHSRSSPIISNHQPSPIISNHHPIRAPNEMAHANARHRNDRELQEDQERSCVPYEVDPANALWYKHRWYHLSVSWQERASHPRMYLKANVMVSLSHMWYQLLSVKGLIVGALSLSCIPQLSWH